MIVIVWELGKVDMKSVAIHLCLILLSAMVDLGHQQKYVIDFNIASLRSLIHKHYALYFKAGKHDFN